MEETRSGYVEEVTYRNEENRYTVFVLSTEEGEKLTCVGFPGQIHAGDPCTVTGTILEHPVYGRQLRLTSFAFREPEGSEATLRYLGSGAVRGIGPALARRIVAAFGDDTMRILERGAREIAGRLESQKDERAAMVYLARYGIGGAQAQKIWDAYGMNLYEVLKENPYRLAEDIQGIGFLRADEIARRMGVRPDSEYRERSGILYTLKESIVQGNTCMGRETLLARAAELLQADKEELSIQLDNLAMDRKVSIREKEEGVFVFLMRVWQAEGAVARLLLDLDAAGAGGMKQETVEERIRQMEEEEKIRLSSPEAPAPERPQRSMRSSAALTGRRNRSSSPLRRGAPQSAWRRRRGGRQRRSTGSSSTMRRTRTVRRSARLPSRRTKTTPWRPLPSSSMRCPWWTCGCSSHFSPRSARART